MTLARPLEERYQSIFKTAPVSIWEEDWTDVIALVREVEAETEAQFRRHIEEHPEFVEQALQGVRVLDVNEHTNEMFQAESKEQLLASLETVFATEDTLPGFVGELVALFNGDEVYRTEMALRTVPGDLVHVLLTMTFPPPGSASGRVLVSLMDISSRVQAEADLKRSEERFRATFEQAAVGIAHVGPDGRFHRINQRYCDILGRSQDEMLGTTFQEITHPDDLDGDLALVEQVLAREIPTYSIDKRYLHRDGSTVWVELTVSLTWQPDGKPDYFIAVVEDVSERKERERERETLVAELEIRTRELEQVVYVTSHDLRSPLVNIHGFSRELAKSLDELAPLIRSEENGEVERQRLEAILEDEVPEALGFIQSSVARMDALLKGLLRLSRAARTKPAMEPLDPRPLIVEVVESMSYQVEQAGARVVLGDLPLCRGDASQLSQVFSNLLVNALEYLAPERPGRIEVSGQLRGDRAVYEVRDNGVGIPEAHQARIFEIFHRLDPAGHSPGEGLGLAIVEKIVRLHGGNAWVRSSPGAGSSFFVALPTAGDEKVDQREA